MRFEFLNTGTPGYLLHPVVQVPIGHWIVPAIQEDRGSPLRVWPIFPHIFGEHIPEFFADIYPVAFLSLSGPLDTPGPLAISNEDKGAILYSSKCSS